MKVLVRGFLSYVLILSSVLPYQAKANEIFTKQDWARVLFMNPDAFNAEFNSRGLYLDANQRVVNGYRLLGFDQAPDSSQKKAFREALKANNFILENNPEQLKNHPRYLQMQSSMEGQAKLIRMYTASFDALQVVRSGDVFERLQERYGQIRAQVISEKLFDSDPNKTVKTQLEINRRLLGEFSDAERIQAKHKVSEFQKLFSNPKARASYNFNNGLQGAEAPTWKQNLSLKSQASNLRGHTTLRVQDPFGKPIDISWPKSAQGLPTEDGSALMKAMKSGVVQTGMIGLALMVVIYGSSEIAMLRSFEDNPRAFEETLEQTMSWAMPSSIASFFVGGAMVGGTAEYLNVARRSKANLHSLVTQSKLLVDKPELRSKLIKANMASLKSSSFLGKATSYPGMTGGFLISQFIYQYVDKLESCRKELGGLENGAYTPTERAKISQACDKTIAQITSELASSPQTWMQLTALLSTKALMTFGMSRLQMLKYAAPSSPSAKSALQGASKSIPYKVKIASRGLLASPIVGTIVGFAVFSLVFWAASQALEWGAGRLTLNMPATQAAQNIRDLFRMYQAQGWDLQKLCDDRNLLQGGLLDHLRPLAFWKSKEDRCGDELVNAFIQQHSDNNKLWRKSLTDPTLTAIEKWTEFTFKAMNLQKASYIFYKDIAEQIKAQRNSGQDLVFRRANNPKTAASENLGYINTHLYNHPLPLFRSEPYFGWSYRLATDTAENIEYPIWNGRLTTWSERFNTRHGSDNLTARKEKFKNTVLPVVVRRLEERAASLSGNTNSINDEKKKIGQILNLLKPSAGKALLLENIARGLHLISLIAERQSTGVNCLSGRDCFWFDFQKEFFDADIWTVKTAEEIALNGAEPNPENPPTTPSVIAPEDKLKAFSFIKGKDYYAGYQTSADKPFGVKPIGPGQGFFINYHSRLLNNEVDPYFYDTNYSSMTDYLLKQMVCGVNVEAGQEMREQSYTDWAIRGLTFGYFGSPEVLNNRRDKRIAAEFKAPKIPLKGNMNPCFNDESNNRWRRSGPANAPSFYNYMEDVNNPDINYGGIVEFLYKEAGDNFVQDFETWWQSYVENQFAEVLDNLYENHFKSELIDQQLETMIVKDNYDNNCFEVCREFGFSHKKGFAAAIKQEMDTYFTYYFSPLLQDISLDLSKSGLTDVRAGRQKLSADFVKIRSEIYDIFAFASGKSHSLSLPDLVADYKDILEEVQAEVLMENPEITPNYEILKLRALKALLVEKDYEMRVLTRTDDSDALDRIYVYAMTLLNEMDTITESEREILSLNIRTNYETLTRDFNSLDNRLGKVIFRFTDWPGDQPGATAEDQDKDSPTFLIVKQMQNKVLELMDEILEMQIRKDMFQDRR